MASHRNQSPRRLLRIFCDYGAEWPLWENGMQAPEDYGLSDALSDKLAAWNHQFQDNMHWELGWRAGFDTEAWERTGRRLARDTQRETRDMIRIRYGP